MCQQCWMRQICRPVPQPMRLQPLFLGRYRRHAYLRQQQLRRQPLLLTDTHKGDGDTPSPLPLSNPCATMEKNPLRGAQGTMEKNYRAHLTGVFGDPVDGNPTGVMEEAAYAAKGLNFRYITMQVKAEDLEAAFAGAKAMHFDGFNLTMPHKIRVIPLLDRLTEAASIIGAVNTVYRDGGDWVGENTDGKGFVQALTAQGVDLHGKRVTILGAGGAARAIGVECALAGRIVHHGNQPQ